MNNSLDFTHTLDVLFGSNTKPLETAVELYHQAPIDQRIRSEHFSNEQNIMNTFLSLRTLS